MLGALARDAFSVTHRLNVRIVGAMPQSEQGAPFRLEWSPHGEVSPILYGRHGRSEQFPLPIIQADVPFVTRVHVHNSPYSSQ